MMFNAGLKCVFVKAIFNTARSKHVKQNSNSINVTAAKLLNNIKGLCLILSEEKDTITLYKDRLFTSFSIALKLLCIFYQYNKK
jgi:hypothetical protein